MRYLLDTNIVSHLIRGNQAVTARALAVPMMAISISSVTEGELIYGLCKRPEAARLHRSVHAFLIRVDVLPWDRAAATRYGDLRAQLERQGRSLGPLDMMIAAHALSTDSSLATNDRAFGAVPGLAIEDWTATHQPR